MCSKTYVLIQIMTIIISIIISFTNLSLEGVHRNLDL